MKIFFDKLIEMGYSVILKEHLTVSEREKSRGREREVERERRVSKDQRAVNLCLFL